MDEDLADDRAANAAVVTVIAQGLFRREAFIRSDLWRHVGGLRNFRAWLADFDRTDSPGRDRLIARVARALREAKDAGIVTVGPIEVRALRKLPR